MNAEGDSLRPLKNQNAMATIRDVARESGFSPATVSIVLNNAPLARYIPAPTKKRIELAANKLGYRPNVIARFLRSRRNQTVGVMVFDLNDPFCIPVLRGIQDTLAQASYLPLLTDVRNQRSRFERYLEMILGRQVEGLIVVANWLFVDIDLLGDLEKRNVPSVVIGRELKTDSISSVMVDNEAGAHLALEHLYSLGHRKIAFIRGPRMLVDTAPRWRGIKSFAESAGLAIDPRLVFELPDSKDPNTGFEGGIQFAEELLRHKRKFTALMAFDDMTAFGSIRGLTKAGVKVPEECSVIGFDDVAPSAIATPALTTIRQPLETMGITAVSLVLEGMNAGFEKKEFVAVHRKVPPELVVRESTRPIP
jgi:LacI family transcriptional regulator